MGDFRKLEVWQLAHRMACEVYRETATFPKTEAYGLTSQLRRSAASVPANIAEGCGRRGDAGVLRVQGMLAGLNRVLKKPHVRPGP